MQAKRYHLASLTIDGQDVRVKYADLLVARHDNRAELDWECVVMPFATDAMEQGAYRVRATTIEGLALAGDAVLVRSVQGTHVLRGAGPLDGFDPDELDDTDGTGASTR